MNQKSFKPRRAMYLAPIAALSLLSGVAQAQLQHAQMSQPMAMPQSHMQQGQQGKSGSDGMKHSMMSGMEKMKKMPMSGDADKDFAMMMKVHHQQALQMAQMELEHGKAPEMKAMAQKIIVAQKKEIAEFDQWLDKQK